jgi:lipopolysaccharide export system permease protein
MFIINEKIIFKKFFTKNTYFFLLAAFSISFIVWIIQAVNNLSIVSEDGHSFFIYFSYSLLIFPKIFGKILPIIFFTSLFYTLIKYENNNELKIFWITGINKTKFYNFILKYTILFFILHLLIAAYLGPYLQNKARNYIKDSTLDFFPSLFQEKKFIDTVDKLTIFIESKNNNNQFTNIYLKDETNKDPRIIFAKKGYLISTENQKILRLIDGKFMNMNGSKNTTSFNFSKTDFNLSNFSTKTTTHRKLQEMQISLLLKCIIYTSIKKEVYNNENINCNKDSLNEIQSEVYSRIFKPFYLFLLTSIVIFLITSNNENKNFRILKPFIFILGITAIVISEITVDYSGNGNLNMMLCILFPIIMSLILSAIFYRSVNYTNNKL